LLTFNSEKLEFEITKNKVLGEEIIKHKKKIAKLKHLLLTYQGQVLTKPEQTESIKEDVTKISEIEKLTSSINKKDISEDQTSQEKKNPDIVLKTLPVLDTEKKETDIKSEGMVQQITIQNGQN
jgi:hypothetical protein